MRGSALFAILYVTVIETAISKPLWPTLIDHNYVYSMPEINAQPYYLGAYQNTHSPYYVYNVHMNTAGIPTTIYANGKPEASLPSYSFYYGTPIYDFRIPLNPIYPVLMPSHPGFLPRPTLPPTSTQEPFDEDDYDGIEKLDSRFDPNTETKKPENNEQDDDSVTVEAL